MYRNTRRYAHPFSIPFISEGLKTGSLFSKVLDCLARSGRSQKAVYPFKFNTKARSKWLIKASHPDTGFLTFIPGCYWITRLIDQEIAPQFTSRITQQNSAGFLGYSQRHLRRYWERRFQGDCPSIFSRQNQTKLGVFFGVVPTAVELLGGER